jgi:serine/threonine protein kinase
LEAALESGTPFGRYRLLDLLGRGGMGEVWRAFDTVTERVVALKVLPTEFADDAVFQERFRREAKSAAGLDEPHVVPIYDFGEIDGRLFVTMRLIKGRDLQSILSDARMDPARAVRIIDQVASALHAAHQVNLVHRDVKPSNILVCDDDFAYLIDFGIARAAGQSSLTGTAHVVGTWAYLAPERITADQTDARADIYALACVLYECLTGSQPFPGNSLEQQLGGHLSMPPPRPSERRADVPAQLDAVIAKGMAKSPDDRYNTTRELARAAIAAATGPVTIPSPPAPTAAGPFAHTQSTWQPQYGQGNPAMAARGGPPSGGPAQYPPMQYNQPQPSPVAPTAAPAPADPNHYRPMFYGTPPPAPKSSRKGPLIALASIGTAVVVVGAVVALVLSNSGDDNTSPHHGPTPSATPNTGPFTGTYTVELGRAALSSGTAAQDADAGAFTESWRLRSACNDASCVATAASGGRYPTKDLVFDKVGAGWVAVTTSRRKCGNRDNDEAWNAISVQPQSEGAMTGEFTQATVNGCYLKRSVTFTRTGDTDVTALPDPNSLARRVVSPAGALHGRYESATIYANGDKWVDQLGVRTDCLRTGDRCVSPFLDTKNDTDQVFVFANGTWTRNTEFDSTCSLGGTAHVTSTASLQIPQPVQDPIPLLAGHGYADLAPGSKCRSQAYDESFTRTGD